MTTAEKIRVWGKLQLYLVMLNNNSNDPDEVDGMCHAILLLHQKRILSEEEYWYCKNEIRQDIMHEFPEVEYEYINAQYLFMPFDYISRINYCENKIKSLKNDTN